MSMFHLVVPMAGAGSRFSKSGWKLPKPLIELNGRPFFVWSVLPVKKLSAVKDITFVVLQEHVSEFGIDKEILCFFPDARIRVIPKVLPGQVFTCMEGVRDISDDLPVMFNDCDHMFSSGSAFGALTDGFSYDGGLVTFESNSPAFSYVRCDQEGRVIGTAEKNPVSTRAICGAYIFRSCGLFRDLASEYVNSCPYSECFVSGVYNIMCSRNMRIGVFNADYNIDFGTPEQYELVKSSEHFEEDFSCALQES